MRNRPPLPVSKAFLPITGITEHPNGDASLIGIRCVFTKHSFPTATNMGFFARVASAHGQYQIEVQLQTPDGNTVWRDGPPDPWTLDNPLTCYDLKIGLTPVFPGPGKYDFVLMMNDEEVARQSYEIQLTPRHKAGDPKQGAADDK